MSLFSEIRSLKVLILETERMLSYVKDHPLMAKNFEERLKELNERLSSYPSEVFEPRVDLLFSGTAVKGSEGIKSEFISDTIKPFQELVKTQTSLNRFGQVGRRGQARRSGNTELYLTAIRKGSFGVELCKLESNDLFDEQDVANAIHQVMNLINISAESDEAFESIVEHTPKRNLTNLRKFLKVISSEDSVLKMESGTTGIEITKEGISQAFERVDGAIEDSNELYIRGILRGFLLDSGKFEVTKEDGVSISGLISETISEDQIIEFDRRFLNAHCKIHMNVVKTTFKTGREKVTYELLDIKSIE